MLVLALAHIKYLPFLTTDGNTPMTMLHISFGAGGLRNKRSRTAADKRGSGSSSEDEVVVEVARADRSSKRGGGGGTKNSFSTGGGASAEARAATRFVRSYVRMTFRTRH